jgi:MFS family permease
VRLPLNFANAASQRATVRTLTAPYYGWVLVGVLGVTEAISWGVLYYAFSVFLTPMETDLGWSRGETTGAFSLALVLSGFAAIGAGRWLDRHGARALMTAGSCIGVVLVLAWASANTLLVFYVVWAAIGLVMATVLYEPAFAVVTVWFDRKRVRALTAVTLIAGFSSTVFLPLSAWLVEVQGWRPALVTLAVILAAGTIPAHALLLRRRPEDLGLHPDGESLPHNPAHRPVRTSLTPGAALRDPTFRWVTLAFCLSTAVAFGAQVHLVPILLERGFSPILAATLAGLIGAMQVLGRVLMTPFAGRVSLRSLSVVVLAIQPIALLVLLLVPDLAGVIAFIGALRCGQGLPDACTPGVYRGSVWPCPLCEHRGCACLRRDARSGNRASGCWCGVRRNRSLRPDLVGSCAGVDAGELVSATRRTRRKPIRLSFGGRPTAIAQRLQTRLPGLAMYPYTFSYL